MAIQGNVFWDQWKTGNTYLQNDSSNGKLWVFDHAQLAEINPGRLQQRPTTENCNFWQSVVVAIIWLILCRARHHRKSRIWRGNLDAICHSSRDVIISGLAAISTFPVVDHCCTYLPTLFYTYTWSYTPESLEF